MIKFIRAIAYSILLIVFFSASPLEAKKPLPATESYHFKAVYSFRVTEESSDEIRIIRNIPAPSPHQSVTAESLKCGVPATLEVSQAGPNRFFTCIFGKKAYYDHCLKRSQPPGDTIEITYECDYTGYLLDELHGAFKFGFYKLKTSETQIVRARLENLTRFAGAPGVSPIFGAEGETDESGLKKLFDFINRDIKYTRAPQKRGPAVTLERMTGNCVSKTNLWRAFLTQMRVRSCNVSCVILSPKNYDVTHRFSIVKLGGRNVPFCPTNGHFAKIPARYMILSYFRKDNKTIGIKKVSMRFYITKSKQAVRIETPEEEHVGDTDDIDSRQDENQ